MDVAAQQAWDELFERADQANQHHDHRRARSLFNQALNLAEQAARADPDEPSHRGSMALVLTRLADIALIDDNLAVAWLLQERAVTILEMIVDVGRDDDGRYRCDLAIALAHLGEIPEMINDFPNAEELYERAQRICDELLSSDPTNVLYLRVDAHTRMNRSGLARLQGDHRTALDMCTTSQVITESLVTENPSKPMHLYSLGVSLLNRSVLAEWTAVARPSSPTEPLSRRTAPGIRCRPGRSS